MLKKIRLAKIYLLERARQNPSNALSHRPRGLMAGANCTWELFCFSASWKSRARAQEYGHELWKSYM